MLNIEINKKIGKWCLNKNIPYFTKDIWYDVIGCLSNKLMWVINT